MMLPGKVSGAQFLALSFPLCLLPRKAKALAIKPFSLLPWFAVFLSGLWSLSVVCLFIERYESGDFMSGNVLVEIFDAILPAAGAQAVAAGISTVTGSRPAVVAYSDHSEIVLTPEQEDLLAQWIVGQLNKEPGRVRVNLSGVATKVLFRKYWGWMAAAVAGGALLGAAMRGKGRKR